MSALPDNIRSRIESLGIHFECKGTIKTSMNHIERETWILEYEGSQFVYVAGQKNVTLGWDTHQCPLGDGVLDDLREYFEQGQEYYQDQMAEMKEYYAQQITKSNAKKRTTARGVSGRVGKFKRRNARCRLYKLDGFHGKVECTPV